LEEAPFTPGDYVELFFDLFEASSDVVYIIRLSDGLILDANESALSLWGFDRESAIGHSTLELDLWARPSDRDRYVEAVREAGRVRDYPVRFRNRWSEEYTLYLSAHMGHLRGEDVIMGIGILHPVKPESPVGDSAA
jgi:PAS domain S-box-containing protein